MFALSLFILLFPFALTLSHIHCHFVFSTTLFLSNMLKGNITGTMEGSALERFKSLEEYERLKNAELAAQIEVRHFSFCSTIMFILTLIAAS